MVDSHEEYWIGIDLGTCNSCAGVWMNEQVVILQNPEDGAVTTPSVVGYKEGNEVMVGRSALNLGIKNPANTIYDAKRLLGRRFDDKDVTRDIALWPFKVIEGDEHRPKIVVDGKELYPEQISAKVLEKMKQCAERKVG